MPVNAVAGPVPATGVVPPPIGEGGRRVSASGGCSGRMGWRTLAPLHRAGGGCDLSGSCGAAGAGAARGADAVSRRRWRCAGARGAGHGAEGRRPARLAAEDGRRGRARPHAHAGCADAGAAAGAGRVSGSAAQPRPVPVAGRAGRLSRRHAGRLAGRQRGRHAARAAALSRPAYTLCAPRAGALGAARGALASARQRARPGAGGAGRASCLPPGRWERAGPR